MEDYREALNECRTLLDGYVNRGEVDFVTGAKLFNELERILSGSEEIIVQADKVFQIGDVCSNGSMVRVGPTRRFSYASGLGRVTVGLVHNVGHRYSREDLLELGKVSNLNPKELERLFESSRYFRFVKEGRPASYRLERK
jgi:hypothetical protein